MNVRGASVLAVVATAVLVMTMTTGASAQIVNVPIAANSAAIAGVTSQTTNYTFTLSNINTYTQYWFVLTIERGFFGAGSGYEDSVVQIKTYSSVKSYGFPNGTVASSGASTNGQVVMTLDPREAYLYLTTGATIHFQVKNIGSGPGQPYNVTLYTSAATSVTEDVSGFSIPLGSFSGARTFTGSLPCCGARWQLVIATDYHLGYYLISNVTATNNSIGAITLWEDGTAGVPNTVEWNAGDTVRSTSTCSGLSVCTIYNNKYWMEVQSPEDQQYSTQFSLQFQYELATNAPTYTGGNPNGTYSSTGSGAEWTTARPNTALFAAAALAVGAVVQRIVA